MMRIADMHCDTLIEGWRHLKEAFMMEMLR